MKRIIILLALIFLYAYYSPVKAQAPAIEWQNTIGGNDIDVGRSLYKTDDGGYIVGGYSLSGISGDKTETSQGNYDIWLVKLDAGGIIQWQSAIGGSDRDVLNSIKQTTDGGYILGAYSRSGISGDKTEASQGGYDYWVVKVDASGNIQWQNTIGGSLDDFVNSIRQTDDGGYIVGGSSQSGISGDKTEVTLGTWDCWIVKLDASGNIQWQNTIGGSDWDAVDSDQVIQTSDGGYLVGAFSNSGISGDKTESCKGSHDYWVVKLDATGSITWQNTIGGSDYEYLKSVVQTSDGGYMIGGYSRSGISGDKTEACQGSYDYWILKLDATGVIQWQKTIGGNSDDMMWCVSVTSDSGYILGGYSKSSISGHKTEGSQGGNDYWILKLDATGAIEWQKTLGGSLDEMSFHEIFETTDGGYIIGGFSTSGISGDKSEPCQGNRDYWIIKLFDDNPLPVELVDFSASCDNESVQLNWTTSSEINNDYFTIEKSTDLINWDYLTTIEGAGFSNELIEYSVLDEKIIPNINLYYRLVQTDYDGQVNYYDVASVNCIEEFDSDDIYIVNNEYENAFDIIFNYTEEVSVEVSIVDYTGRLVYVNEYFVNAQNKFSIPKSRISPGLYNLVFEINDKVVTKQIIVPW